MSATVVSVMNNNSVQVVRFRFQSVVSLPNLFLELSNLGLHFFNLLFKLAFQFTEDFSYGLFLSWLKFSDRFTGLRSESLNSRLRRTNSILLSLDRE